MTEKNAIQKGMLYLVATPIGNLSDLSERALKVLSSVDLVAAEDTRNSGLLLNHFGISKPFISYFEHNKRERGLQIIDMLKDGKSIALVTDAGTPAISDPGEDLVRLCAEHNIPVTSIPGCCASITALTLSALSSRRFCFEGFLPTSSKELRERLSELSSETRTMIFYEAPHRLLDTLKQFITTFGPERSVSVCRELTKINEEIFRATLQQAYDHFLDTKPKGEFVLVLEGNKITSKKEYPENPTDHLNYYLEEGLSRMDAMKAAAKDRGISKGAFYQLIEAEKSSD